MPTPTETEDLARVREDLTSAQAQLQVMLNMETPERRRRRELGAQMVQDARQGLTLYEMAIKHEVSADAVPSLLAPYGVTMPRVRSRKGSQKIVRDGEVVKAYEAVKSMREVAFRFSISHQRVAQILLRAECPSYMEHRAASPDGDNRVTVRCQGCGNEFRTFPSWQRQGKKFCSWACRMTPCTCGQTPHRSPCQGVMQEWRRRKRAERLGGGER